MKLATLRTGSSAGNHASHIAVRIDGEGADATATVIDGFADVGSLLADPAWRDRAAAAGGAVRPVAEIADAEWAPVIPAPSKIVCVGLNYRTHILEMGRDLPAYPTLFAKYPEALLGPYDDIVLPPHAADAVDWEAELAVVIGAPARRLDEDAAADVIAGYSLMQDITMRDYQYRSPEWFQGKTFEATAPFGPVLVTTDEYALGGVVAGEVNGESVQHATTDDLVFSPAALVAYISDIVTLNPGDVVLSGTPGGVGHAHTPKRYLAPGDVLGTFADGIGALRNRIVAGN